MNVARSFCPKRFKPESPLPADAVSAAHRSWRLGHARSKQRESAAESIVRIELSF